MMQEVLNPDIVETHPVWGPFVTISAHLYLTRIIESMNSDLLARAAVEGQIVGAGTRLRMVHPRRRGIHPAGVVEISQNGSSWKPLWFAKADDPKYAGGQSLETEYTFLSDIAPAITATNQELRCATPVAFFPQERLLLMEVVLGASLKEHLFDLRSGASADLAHLLNLCGEWLGKLHTLTSRAKFGNPLGSLIQHFEGKKIRGGLAGIGCGRQHREILNRLQRLVHVAPQFERPLCRVHGEFTPLHILVKSGAIYVVDLATSREGYPYEDFSLFTTFYEGLLPWRHAVGDMRLTIARQKQIFTNAYFQQSPFPFNQADQVLLKCTRICSLMHLLSGRNVKNGSWVWRSLSFAGRRLLRNRLEDACRDALVSLQQTPDSVFTESDQETSPASKRRDLPGTA